MTVCKPYKQLHESCARTRLAIVVGLLSAPLVVSAGILGPSTYEECILDAMRGVQSDVAARQIVMACRKRFPTKQPSTVPSSPSPRPLPEDAIGRLQAKFEFRKFTGEYLGELYNGNSNWRVQKLIIRVYSESKSGNKTTAQSDYAVDAEVQPLTKTPITLAPFLEKDARWQWSIVAAYGFAVSP